MWTSYIVIDGKVIDNYEFHTSGSYNFSGSKPLPRIGETIKLSVPHADKKKGKGYLIELYKVIVRDIVHDNLVYRTDLVCQELKHFKIDSKNYKEEVAKL